MNTKIMVMFALKAEYVYGDTDSVFFTFNLKIWMEIHIRGKKALRNYN